MVSAVLLIVCELFSVSIAAFLGAKANKERGINL